MKKTILSIILLLVLILLCSIFILVSYGGNDHTHNYSTEWAKDGSYHWQACSGCEETRNKAEHDWNSGVVTLQPTSTSEGARTYTCNTCGHTRIESIPVLDTHEHTFSETWSSNETHHWHRATCEHTEEKKDYGEHSWNAGEITTTPTESDEGVKTFTCTTCQKTKTETVPALGDSHVHEYNQQVATSKYLKHEATCSQKAEYHYSCSCGATGTTTFEYGDFADHEYSNTWSHNDTHHWYSAVCDHANEKKDYGAHDWNNGIITTEPTTSTKGEKTFTCQSCGKTKTEEVPILEEEHTHIYDQLIPDTKYIASVATCTAQATYFKSCSCGLWGTETFEHGELADHKYSSVWSYNDTHHWHAATCEHSSEKKDNSEHDWDAGVVTKQPTETTEGEKTYTCDVCQKTKVDSIGKLDHIHTFDTEYSFDDNYHWYAATCVHTGEVKNKAAHRWNAGVVTSEATVYDEGEKLYTCQDCGHTKEETIAKIPSFTVVFYDSDNKIISKNNYKLNTVSSQIVIPIIQAEEGFQFETWINIYDSKSVAEIDFSKAQENAVYQFKPTFVKIHEVIFIDFEGNQLGEALIVKDGEKLTANHLPTIPSRTGYTSKWDEQILSTKITEFKIFAPTYEVITFEVTFLDAKNGAEIATRTVEYGSFAIIPKHERYRFTTKLYGFTGWKSSTTNTFVDNVNGNRLTDIYSNMTVYAVYEESIEQPVLAAHIDGTTVTMSLCMPDGSSLYSINMSMGWVTEKGICEVTGATISSVTPLNKGNCGEENCTVYTDKVDWLVYNNKAKTIDFIWNCGNGHSFSTSINVITLTFGVDDGAQINEAIFSMFDGSNVVYGENGANINDLSKSNITIWFY